MLNCAAVTLIVIDKCESTEPWSSVEVPSSSELGKFYTVVRPWPEDGPSDFVCECPGYLYKGSCKHQEMAASMYCDWDERVGPQNQTKEQHLARSCPRCGATTIRSVEIV